MGKRTKRERTNRACGGQVFQPKGREGDGRPWYVRWTKPDGSRVSERAMVESTGVDGKTTSRPADTKTEAETALTRLVTTNEETAQADRARGCRSVTMRECWTDEIRKNAKGRLSERQFKNVEAQILRCADSFPDVPMFRIGRPSMEAYFTKIRAEGVREAAPEGQEPGTGELHPLSVTTLTRNRAALSKFWDEAIERRAAIENPLRKVKFGRPQEEEPTFLTVEQLAELYKHTPATIRPIIVLLAETGARFGEVHSLRWDQVAHDFSAITFTRTKSGRTRRVPVTQRGRDLLKELHEGHVAPLTGPDLVLAKHASSHSYVLRTFRDALNAAGLPEKTRIHDLRHSYASQLVQNGVALSVVAALLGHSSMVVTSRYAKHAPASLVAQAVQVLERARAGAKGTKAKTKPRTKRTPKTETPPAAVAASA